MVDPPSQYPGLDSMPPSALHALECADGTLRHSTGMRALGALKMLATLASSRMDRPGFREKLDAARKGAALAREECEAFFQVRPFQDTTIGGLFPEAQSIVTEKLGGLAALPLHELPAAIDAVVAALGDITKAIQAARRSLREFLASETPRLASLCEAAHARLVTRDSSSEDRKAFLDPSRLSDALTELVNNALKHAVREEGGTVRVEVADGSSPNSVMLVVADDGRGIPAEVQARLFERGVTTGGSGEGLALVREIIETEHLGRLTYMTGPSGTRWEIVLPVKIPRVQLHERLKAIEVRATPQPARAAMPRAVLVTVALAAAGALALIAWPLLGGRADRGTAPTPDTSKATAPPSGAPTRAAPATSVTGPVDSKPGRAPEGFAAVPEAGRHVPTGWAREITQEKTGIRLVFVPAGEFVMGSDEHDTNEGPAHRVRLTKPFYLGKTEVTQAQHKKLMGENPSRFKGDDLPVERVSFVDCYTFCAKAGLRLPTEAEWEYAARSSTPAPSHEQRTRPVGQASPNSLGLLDMLGNVAEWCFDWYDLYPPGDTVDPKGPPPRERRVVRGGSFLTDPTQLRATLRSSLGPMEKWDFVGFRVALDAQ
jgi:formylglycine-generating enzyme required for sulfatase activity